MTDDDRDKEQQQARVRELVRGYDQCLKLRDPDTAPDKWTRDVVALRNIATVEHDADCPGHEANVAAYLAEHDLTLDNMGALVYGIRPDRKLEPLFKEDAGDNDGPDIAGEFIFDSRDW
jgi:hypothetical protein